MYDKIRITDEDIENLNDMDVPEYDKRGQLKFNKVKYLPKSVRLPIRTLVALQGCTKIAFGIYIGILDQLANNTNEVKVTRQFLKTFLDCSDAAISRGIKELETCGLIRVENKTNFIIPIETGYKGNLNTIIKKYKEREEEIRRIKQERLNSARSINDLIINVNNNGSKSKET